MEHELFVKTYMPILMRIVKQHSETLNEEIVEALNSENHHIILKAKHKMESLAECKMLLATYEGCPYCLEPDCSSDHK